MKKKIFLPVAATVIALAIFTGGAVMAQQNGTGETGVVQTFVSRVAAILNLPETDVQKAMDQARQDMQNESIKTRLDSMVEQGVLTQPQADEYYNWFQSRPEGIPGFGDRGPGFEFRGHGHRHGYGMKGPEGIFGAPGEAAPSQDGTSSGTSF